MLIVSTMYVELHHSAWWGAVVCSLLFFLFLEWRVDVKSTTEKTVSPILYSIHAYVADATYGGVCATPHNVLEFKSNRPKPRLPHKTREKRKRNQLPLH